MSEPEDPESFWRRKMMMPRSPEEAERFRDLDQLDEGLAEERRLENTDTGEDQLRREMGLAPGPSEQVVDEGEIEEPETETGPALYVFPGKQRWQE